MGRPKAQGVGKEKGEGKRRENRTKLKGRREKDVRRE